MNEAQELMAVLGHTYLNYVRTQAQVQLHQVALKEAQDGSAALMEQYKTLSAEHEAALAKIKTLEATPPPTEAS